MKVLIATGWYPTVSNREDGDFVRYQSAALASYNDLDVSVFFVDLQWRYFLRWASSPFRYSSRYYHLLEYRVEGFGWPRRWRWSYRWYNRRVEKELYRYIDACGLPDLIHIHSYHTALAVCRVSDHFRIPWVMTEHSTTLFDDRQPPCGDVQLYADLCGQADACVTVSSGLADRVQSLTAVKPIVIPNPVERTIFYPSVRKVHTPIRLISVGSLIPRKNYEDLIHVVKRVVASVPVDLRIVGSGPRKRKLQKMSRDLGVDQFVTFVGQVPYDQMGDQYRAADVLVSTSRLETFGQMYAEAIACGLPVIAYDSIGVRDIITSPAHGELVSSVDTMVAALLRFIEQPYIIDTLKCDAVVDTQRFVQQYGVLYRKLTLIS